MKKVIAARLSSDITTITAPANIAVLDFKQHLDGPRIWFESNDTEEDITYTIERVKLGGENNIPVNVVQSGENWIAFYKPLLPKEAVILGILFNDQWKPIMFVLIPAEKTEYVQREIFLGQDKVEIPTGYSYHSTSLKPNWQSEHLFYKN